MECVVAFSDFGFILHRSFPVPDCIAAKSQISGFALLKIKNNMFNPFVNTSGATGNERGASGGKTGMNASQLWVKFYGKKQPVIYGHYMIQQL
jgi:hypothetical protein